MATSYEDLTHWKRPWCWEGLGAGREEGDRGWDGWMASPTQCTWVWVNSRSWWCTGRPGELWVMGLRRVGHDWVTELNWTEHLLYLCISSFLRNWINSNSLPFFHLLQEWESYVSKASWGCSTSHWCSFLLCFSPLCFILDRLNCCVFTVN